MSAHLVHRLYWSSFPSCWPCKSQYGARTPLWAPPGVVWRWIHSSAPAPRCCQCRRAAWRGTVCPAPLPLGTAARYWALAPTARSCERAAAAAASRDLLGRGAAAPFPPCCLQHITWQHAMHCLQLGGRVGRNKLVSWRRDRGRLRSWSVSWSSVALVGVSRAWLAWRS